MDSGVLAALITGGAAVLVAALGLGINAFWLRRYLDTRFTSIDKKLDKVETKLEEVEKTVNSIDKRVAILEDRAGRLVTEVHQ